jgi:hypothetical protein
MAAKVAVEEVVDTETLKDLVRGVKDLAESQNAARQKTALEIEEDSPFNNAENRRTAKLKKDFYQNGIRINPNFLTQQETVLLNQLKTGQYNHKKWQVKRRRDGSIDLRYPNKTFEQRMENKGIAVNLEAMLKLIITEQEAQAKRRKAGETDDEDF